eukprot:8755908-Alexandrium_andersonii.AAC.1
MLAAVRHKEPPEGGAEPLGAASPPEPRAPRFPPGLLPHPGTPQKERRRRLLGVSGGRWPPGEEQGSPGRRQPPPKARIPK